MKILVLADEESKALWDYYTPDKLQGVEMIIACGDLKAEYLEFLVTMTNLPLFYVPGNHDSKYETNPPDGCVCIDDKIVEYKGVRMLGFGGSMRYKKGPYQYNEKEMRHRIWKLKHQIYPCACQRLRGHGRSGAYRFCLFRRTYETLPSAVHDPRSCAQDV